MSFRPAPLAALALGLVCLLLPRTALAWVETTVLAHEARVEVARQGTAQIEHTIKVRVRGGPLRSFDIKIADQNVALAGEAWMANAREGLAAKMPIPVSIEQRPDGDLRVDIDGRKGVRRGEYELRFKYDIDLLRQDAVARDGTMLRLEWIGPHWGDGVDNVRCVFAIPASPTEPRPIGEVRLHGAEEESSPSHLGTFLSTLTRLPEFDEITLIRPHVAKGEQVRWGVRIDPKALGELNDPRLRTAPVVEARAEIPPQDRALHLSIAGIVALLYSVVLALKHHQVSRAARQRGVSPRPLFPIGMALRVAFAGPALAASLGAQVILDDPLPGSLGILLVVGLTAYRSPERKVQPRGPGRWLPLADEDAWARQTARGSDWLDVSTVVGKCVFALAMIGVGVGVFFLSRVSPYLAHLAALDSVVIVALLGTGRRSELPPHLVGSAVSALRTIATGLRKKKDIRAKVKAIARFPQGSKEPDELRLTVKPRTAPRGFVNIEVGLAWAHGAGGAVAVPEVLLRVVDGSPCHEAMTQRMSRARWLRGRETYERVLLLSPPIPSPELAVTLVRDLANAIATSAAETIDEPKVKPTQPRRARAQARGRARVWGTTSEQSLPLPVDGSW